MMGSFGPADVATFDDATAGLAWPEYAGVSGELAAKVASHNERAAKVKAQLKASNAGFAEAMRKIDSGCEPTEYGALFATVETCKLDRTTMLTELVALWNQRVTLADDHAAEFTAMLPKLEKTLAETIAKVAADLESIGSGLEAMPAYPERTTAARQLQLKATNENVHSRRARNAVVSGRSLVDAAYEQRRTSVAGQATARKYVASVARNMMAGV
jgi:hypothetical protein